MFIWISTRICGYEVVNKKFRLLKHAIKVGLCTGFDDFVVICSEFVGFCCDLGFGF
jgi:hypothetical protein